ncbi:hypothetical protein C4A77_19030 [Brevibacillus laterosporus]|uniref:Uncharacterized protein n=1 Tax=Brevibacillus laterosporus TaxID=1465 RepID=A0AAP8QBB5_BRELA|nr:hypothetical protein C4A77_19030 [Brevibacillus laterosporus]
MQIWIVHQRMAELWFINKTRELTDSEMTEMSKIYISSIAMQGLHPFVFQFLLKIGRGDSRNNYLLKLHLKILRSFRKG